MKVEKLQMIELWKELLPRKYQERVVNPVIFECHSDPVANADKILGLDITGNRCFYYHTFLLIEESAATNKTSVELGIYYERVVAWRLNDSSQWIRIKSLTDPIDRYRKRLTTLPVEITDSMPK